MKVKEKYKIFKYPNGEGIMKYILFIVTPDGSVEKEISEFEYMDIERAFKRHTEMEIIHHNTNNDGKRNL